MLATPLYNERKDPPRDVHKQLAGPGAAGRRCQRLSTRNLSDAPLLLRVQVAPKQSLVGFRRRARHGEMEG
eukprot:Skav221097  [mRNA]  locus=scaffold4552:234069:234281:+ [translate_table: standard]